VTNVRINVILHKLSHLSELVEWNLP